MNGRVFSFGSSGNPLVQILSVLAFGVLLAVALIMGAVVIAVLFGLAAIFAAVLAVRVWWARRRRGSPPPADYGYQAEWPEPPPDRKQKRLIEGEYEVVKKKQGAEDTQRRR